MAYQKSGHETEADIALMRSLEDHLEKDPNDVKTLIEKGFLHMEPFHQEDKSLAMFQRALELEPENVDALFWLAKLLYHEYCKEQEPREILEKALRIDPDRAECHGLLASVLYELGEKSNVYIWHLRRAVELEPEWILPRLHLSGRLLKTGDVEGANLEAKKAYELFERLKRPVPTTPIEEYYEDCITGRRSVKQDRFDDLFARIAEARSQAAGEKK